MATPIIVIDENGNTVLVIDRGLVTTPNAVPAPSTKPFIQVPLIQHLSTDGTGLGTTIDLTLDGSVTPIDAFIAARSDGDLYLKSANVFIEGDATILLKDFGTIADGLANGIDTFIEHEGIKFDITRQPILTNLDLVRVGKDTPALGSDDSAFRLKIAGQGNANTAYNPIWDFTTLAAGNEGIRLAANTNQKLGITINDDLRELVTFNIVMEGYVRFV